MGVQPVHHLVISGTGRAGTSFLVRFLGACGLDAGDLGELGWSASARAGLERRVDDAHPPYVVKDPGFSEYCHTLDPEQVVIDALVVPVRDLLQAAASRVAVEREHLLATTGTRPEPAAMGWTTDGGVVYSLDPVDQARLLAVGLGRLLTWAVQREVPLYLLDFPRFVRDGEYLVRQLEPVLSARCTREHALAAFAALADPDLVSTFDVVSDGERTDSWRAERAALVRVLDSQRLRIAELEQQLVDLRADHHRLRVELELSQEVTFSLRRENGHLRGLVDGPRGAGEGR